MDIKTPSTGTPTKVQTGATPATAVVDDEMDKEYIDNRNITISLVHNYSNYRKANIKVLGQRTETIGSSITSCRVLSSNQGEVEAYFPALVGLSPNNPEFISRVKAWLSNIQFPVNNNDATLNITFIYNTKRDYLQFKAREDAIEEEYAKTDRSNTTMIREAVKRRVNALNALESEKYKYGRPQNLEEYLLYRHCLLYRDVAKDPALINGDASLRFYIKDEAKEAEKQRKLTKERKTALRNFIELGASESKFNAVYITMCVARNENVAEALLRSSSEKETILMNFANEQPDKFNKLVKDGNITTKAFIETLIVRGELVRSEFNQQISMSDGTYVGANLNEAVAFFNNPNNKDIRTAYENKLKMF